MTNSHRNELFCFGHGFTAQALCNRLSNQNWLLAGTCREPSKIRNLAEAGINAHRFDRDRPIIDATKVFADTSHLLISVPPDSDGDPVLDCHGTDISYAPSVRWIGYLSTTGVYGDTGGNWVDETADPAPTGPRSMRRTAAENEWLAFGTKNRIPVQIFRLAGIYGPGRNALERVRTGTAKNIIKPDHLFSRIHVDDIAQVLLASMARPNSGAIYNVCDDEPAPGADVINYACSLLNINPPPPTTLEDANLSSMALSFYNDNRRVLNTRIKTELGINLLYPNYRVGLDALFDSYTPLTLT